MSSTEIDTTCAKGKELRRNKPPRFSLKAPVGFCSLKRKKGFLSCWSPACQIEIPQVGHVILWPGSLRDPLWLSLAISQQSQQNYFHLLVSFKFFTRIFAWTSNLSGSQEARLKGSSGTPRCWKSKLSLLLCTPTGPDDLQVGGGTLLLTSFFSKARESLYHGDNLCTWAKELHHGIM